MGAPEAPDGALVLRAAEAGTRSKACPLLCAREYRAGALVQASEQAIGGKICGAVLSYASHEAFVNGLEDMLELPVLTMAQVRIPSALSFGCRTCRLTVALSSVSPLAAQEFERNMEWVDWKGIKYNLRTEWDYVSGPASARDATPGRRDAQHEGLMPHDFLKLANDRITARRKKARDDGIVVLLEDEFAFLTLDEVIAVRLYSGPSYQPLNDFLRQARTPTSRAVVTTPHSALGAPAGPPAASRRWSQVASLRGQIRLDTVRSPLLTFSATIGHICSAIRKLAAVTDPTEADSPLYRGIRGELPRSTWLPNSNGLVCVVDTAFMSTSKNRRTPIEYMGGGSNVLWELQPRSESDVAFHRGADIKMLSQFAHEDEVLHCTVFPCKRHLSLSAELGSRARRSCFLRARCL